MSHRYVWISLLLAVLFVLSATPAFAKPQEEPPGEGSTKFDVALIGDFPYGAVQEVKAENLFEELDSEKLAFIAHDGDIKSGGARCDDAVYYKEFDRFEGSVNPLVYTPGDNEWTDCYRENNGLYDPDERLAFLRSVFFTNPNESLGQRTVPLDFQSADYPENARWSYGGVTFATLHVVGSNNGLTPNNNPAEYEARNAANLAWLDETFEEAQENGSAGVMLVIQANPFEEDINQPSGFTEFKAVLEEKTITFGKPVVLVHGDTHTFRIDKPAISSGQPLPNFTRVETFGSPNVHWVRAKVNAQDPEVFSFKPKIVEENIAP